MKPMDAFCYGTAGLVFTFGVFQVITSEALADWLTWMQIRDAFTLDMLEFIISPRYPVGG